MWLLSSADVFVPFEQINSQTLAPLTPQLSRTLIDFFETNEWVIDLSDDAVTKGELDLVGIDQAIADPRLIIPLMIEESVYGIVVLNEPQVRIDLVWEDYNLLRVVARQAAGFLALQQAEQELRENKELTVFNQLAAFIIHDIKTVTNQLSLLVQNAEHHKSNPAFIDDMLKTNENAVSRMSALLAQLEEHRSSAYADVEIGTTLATCVDRFRSKSPQPQLAALSGEEIWVSCNAEKIATTIAHIIQNAVDATPADGTVKVSLDRDTTWAIIEIADTGTGMTSDFIENKLFRPFESTKGLTGMGIGVYQAREYLRSIGGDIAVTSELDNGSTFTIRIPFTRPTAEGLQANA